MQVLLIDNDKRPRELAARFLSEAGHEVEMVGDIHAAMRLLERRQPDTILLDLSCPGGKILDFLSWLRGIESVKRPYVIMTLSRSGFPPELKSALSHGGDDFVRKPWVAEELLFRVETLTRQVVHASASQACASGPARGAQERHLDLNSGEDLTSLSCWTTADRIMASDLSEMLGINLLIKPVQEGLLHSSYAAQIPMTITQNKAQVQIGIGCQEEAATFLTTQLFGVSEPPHEMIQDLLREFANVVGGAFKRVAEQDHVFMTTGLPEDIQPGEFSSKKSVEQKHFELFDADQTVRIFIEIELRSKGLQKLLVGELREGMVLSRDLLNTNGMLLVRSGTRLTSSNVERLCRLVPDTTSVEVAI